ncbi:MAG: EpsG family protein [Ruminococcaceae bacterium]|nr:EpsG family protein [Oscillospiraceae bacterium]
MVTYYLLLLLPFLVNVTLQAIFDHGRINIINNRKDYKSPVVLVFFIYLSLLLMFRGRTAALDLPNYYYMFHKYSSESLGVLLTADADILYKVLNWIIGRFTNSFQWVLIITGLLSVVPIFLLYNEDKRNGYLKIVLFVNTSLFVVLFSAIRQSIAVGMGVLAYYYVRKKNLPMFILVVIIANMFHHSAFILALMYPMYHTRLNSRHLWIVIPIFLTVYIFRETLFVLFTSVVMEFYEKYETAVTNTGAVATFILYVMFSVFSYVVPDERKMTSELIGLRNFLVFATLMQSFAGLNHLAMRMNYYYILFIPYTMCKLIEIPKREFRRVATVGKCVMCVFFTWYFVTSVRDACYTKDLLGIVPYISMWR